MPARPADTAAPRRLPVAWPVWLAAAALVVLLIVWPPFHIVWKKPAAGPAVTGAPAAFDAPAFASEFWTARLLPAAAGAVEAPAVLSAMRTDIPGAIRQHGHRVGLGNAAFFFVRGSGRITAVERSRILVDVDGATVAIRTGPVFGNVVRDGCGLLDVNTAPGLTEFNALSAELNRMVEERVQPALRSAAVGATVVFAGCAEAPEAVPAGGPMLTIVPIQAELKP